MDKTRMALRRHDIFRRLEAEMALDRAALAARLRELRETHDPPMTQEQAAREIGVPTRSYARWENAEVDAFLSSRQRIADYYKIDVQELVTDDANTTLRVNANDLHRLEAKIDRILGLVEAVAGVPEANLEDAVRAIGSALAGQTPHTAAQPQAARDTKKPTPATNHRRPTRAAGKR